jgi:hypothetical protein
MQSWPIRSCGFFGSGRILKYDGAPTTAMRQIVAGRSTRPLFVFFLQIIQPIQSILEIGILALKEAEFHGYC